MNKPWHEQNKMPRNATPEERLAWHLEHQKHCGCRPIPEALKQMARQKTRASVGHRKEGVIGAEKSAPKAKSLFLEFVRDVVQGDIDKVSRRLADDPALATARAEVGATRQNASDYFFKEIAHYLYAGDTALHMAGAAFRRQLAELLVATGADWRAKNRRGAQPLHYAADANRWAPTAQAETIAYLLSVGADPNAMDNSGVAPLHRAVRTRSLPAVQALLDGGANARMRNKAGSTPLHLAVQTTGRGGSGSQHAREQQAGIIRLLLERGANPTDKDGHGKPVRQAARSEWVRTLLAGGLG